jgi:hypothetical protein
MSRVGEVFLHDEILGELGAGGMGVRAIRLEADDRP